MNREHKILILRSVLQLTHEIARLPRNAFDELLAEMEGSQPKLPSPALQALNADLIARTRLLLQWCNQANEQLESRADLVPMTSAAVIDFLRVMMPSWGTGGPCE